MKPLHHKKHTPAKRFLSLLCVLALCLGLLPVTALAAETNTVYVGNVALAGSSDSIVYATTNESGEVITEGATADDYNIKWDGSTLTLRNATIKKELYASDSPLTNITGAAIGVFNQSGDANLTITLEGTNTIEGVSYGIRVYAPSIGSANLTVTGSGTLYVNSNQDPIYVISSNGNAALGIKNAKVTAKSSYGNGVTVQSGNSETSSASLTVNGGSLTATASSKNVSGIRFVFGSGGSGSGTPNLTVSGNATVRANGSAGGITSNSSTGVQYGTGSSTTGGIVFDGNTGTVYGGVELKENLEIGEGESLTVPEGSSLDSNGKLTNEGTIINEGTLIGEVGGSGTVTPKITTDSLSDGTVGESYTAKLQATGNNITWSVTSGTLPAGLNLSEDGKITGTPTTAGTYTFTVTATNDSGSDSKKYTLTIDPKPTVAVTGVKLNTETLELFTSNTATLTATVEPDNATNKNVTWSSDKPEVATVENGKVTAVGAGEATITVTTADGNYTATCTVKVTDPVYDMTTDTTALNFGSAYTGYAQPAAQTVTVKNTGNQTVTLNQPASTSSFEVGTLSKTTLAAGETATFTVQPKTGLSVGTYSDTIAVTGNGGATLSITASFTVKSRPSYNPPTVSEETTDAIADAQPGETVTVDLSGGDTTLDKEVFETLAGKDVTLVIDLGDDVSWTVKGSDIPEDADFTDLDLGVNLDTSGIPVEVVNAITGEVGTVQMTLAHDGEFGFTMTLTAPLGVENAGYWANLYHYDEDAEQLTFETAAEIDADGSVSLPMSHASQYAIVIDTHSHATVDVSDLFIDIAPDAWYKDAIQYAYDNGLMTGVSDTEFAPEATTTRAMIVSILARLENVTTAQAAGFADVNDNDWYATAVNWAANVGVVNGYEDNTFKPNTAITREQLAAILMNYAAYKGEDVSNRADLTSYTDQPSTWAEETMSWAVAEGLISGVTNTELQPQGNATRAQVAAILQRYLEA